MTSHTNFYVGNPNNPADRETARKLEEARQLSNQAGQTEAAGNVAHAIELHNQALALKVQCFGEQSVQAGLSSNEVGECYLKTGDLQKAEENLLKALKVRDDRKFGGLEIGPRSASPRLLIVAALCFIPARSCSCPVPVACLKGLFVRQGHDVMLLPDRQRL